MENSNFLTLGISDDILKALDDMGFEEATPIQQAGIPLLLNGRDVIGYSQTGTGKTAAFGIPAIEKVDLHQKGDGRFRNKNPQVLVLCPTRELAMQACEEMNRFAKYRRGIRIIAIYGGQAIERQFRLLEYGADIVIGTPGRVMDHMRRGTLRLHNLSMVVLDEADEMLNMGFRDDVETILESVPEERQTALFSATMPPAIVAITHQYQKNPEMIKIVRQQLTVPSIEQFYYEVPFGGKFDAMCRLLESHNPKRSIVFCNTKRQVDELVSELQARGYMVSGLHGDMRQMTRTQVMNGFKRGTVPILVATDVAARGIDVDDVEAVFNYDVPADIEYYVHRIGRTGRAGKNGRAFTLTVGRKQLYDLRSIQNFTKARIVRKNLPSSYDIEKTREKKLFEDIRDELNGPTLSEYTRMVDLLTQEGFTAVEVASALMKMACVSRQDKRKAIDSVAAQPVSRQSVSQQSAGRQANRHSRTLTIDNYQTMDFGREPNSRGQSAQPLDNCGDRDGGARRMMDKGGFSMDKHGDSYGNHSRDRRDMVRLTMDLGSFHKVNAGHIVGAIAGETGLPGKKIGKISVSEKKSFFEVPRQHVDLVLASMKDCKIRGIRAQIRQVESEPLAVDS
ncbi:MAG: DEAD/DEAH box helicase [Gracilibacteraceae bacterium]|jgi:ATP-dependent RNA helicase DeaD|nr:DEAD/DEAH box helicase [Gracilibacteraceae bacterium]